MSRDLQRRLEGVERQAPPKPMGKWHSIIADSNEECTAKEAELMVSSEWQESDNIIAHLIVTPMPPEVWFRQV